MALVEDGALLGSRQLDMGNSGCALFRMWGLGRLGRYRNAFGPQMDGRSGGFERFWDTAPAACWPPGSVVCARVCMRDIIAHPFAAIKGDCPAQVPS